MFQTTWQKILLALFIILILSIPVGAYLLSQRQQVSESQKSSSDRTISIEPSPSVTSPAEELKQLSTPQSTPKTSLPEATPAASVSYGPTLNLKVILEGRPSSNQAGKIFLGVAQGLVTALPQYLLSFSIDLPSSGEFRGLSLAGLTQGSQYTAVLKGSSQIATSSAFVMSPAETNLNSGVPLRLLAGDLNEDNVINSADFAIANSSFGSNQNSTNWNSNVDFNLDGVINTIDLGFIIKNFGKTGQSGVWSSPTPQVGSASATLNPQSPQGQGYWLWVPGF